ncbi:hypothetical protein Tsedi_01598 [Tepidimonas sediminis]|uniref:EF-hand domain-containing protein n=1 Tax=Tepidimonas sediminis TaxID=2588941 RepID=A0A554WN79_9BURK|nr:hypothetical protein [Tepidimonas sediminis]TSE25029.1 hypothetical protein Tsedi_01598 [Tepidimonas sediminis]
MTSAATAHRWRFFRAGGVDQPLIDGADDLRALPGLDPKLWVALACPTSGLTIDPATMALLDRDGDGRIRRPEVLAAVAWVCDRLRDPGMLFDGGASLAPHDLADDEEGRALREAARLVLRRLGRPEDDPLTADDLAEPARVFPPDLPNGDGLVPAALVASDAELEAWVGRLLAVYGSAADRSGQPGIGEAQIAAAQADVAAVRAWRAAQPEGDAATLAAAWQAVQALAAKVEDHYTRCRLAAFDARLQPALDWSPQALATLGEPALAAAGEALAALPLAHVTPEPLLPLRAEALNPAWAAAVEALRVQAVQPLLGEREALTEADWRLLNARLRPWGEWLAARPAVPAADWPPAWLQAWEEEAVAERLHAAVAYDLGAAAQAERIEALRALLLLRRDLVTLLRNMVNFADFYGRAQAAFQIGTLYIDQRECRLCLPVADAAAHAQLAAHSGMYLLYGVCERAGEAPRGLVAALTAGDASDFMVPGRHGLFVDHTGRDWLFTLQRVVDNPISVREAFWLPYRRLGRLVGEQLRKFAAARDQAVQARAGLAGVRHRQVRRHLRRHRLGAGGARHGAGGGGDGLAAAGLVAGAAGHPRDHAADLGALDAAGGAEAAPAQPRPAAGRQRLGGQCACPHRHPLRPPADADGAAAARGAAPAQRRSMKRSSRCVSAP